MNVVTVQELGKSKNGAPKVKASGTWYFLNKTLDSPNVGSTVEIREGSFGDNNQFKTIEAWRPAGGNGHSTQQRNASAPTAPPAGYVDEASMRFISNCVGSAITAGHCKEPGQINAWFKAAKAALEGKDAPIPFDDHISLPVHEDDGWSQQ
jgi:hypothetical protein